MAQKKPGRGRSAIDGRFVTTKFAKQHPRTTIVEKRRTSKRSSKRG